MGVDKIDFVSSAKTHKIIIKNRGLIPNWAANW